MRKWEAMAALALQPIDKSTAGTVALESQAWQDDLPVVSGSPNGTWSPERSGNSQHITYIPQDEEKPRTQSVIRLNRCSDSHKSSFRAFQQWEAVVYELTTDSVWVQLHDLTDKDRDIEDAELLLAEIPMSDRPLLNVGSVLYWSIGMQTAPGGQLQKVSRIRAKRSAPWSAQRLSKIRDKAKATFESIANGTCESSTAR